MTQTLDKEERDCHAALAMTPMLKNKVAIITGGTRGIGKGIAELFAKQGAQVIITGRSPENSTADEINASLGMTEGDETGKVEYMPCSLTKEDGVNKEAIANLISSVQEKHGRIDILINNAGITRDTLFLRMKEDDWNSVIDTNLNAIYHLTQPVVKLMSKQKSGAIINMTSVVGLHGNPAQVNYSTTKAGLIGFTKALAKEYGRRGIRVNAIAPGFIATEMTDELPDDVKSKYKENIPLGDFGSVQDIAEAALFLAANSSYITGQVIQVDGGLFM